MSAIETPEYAAMLRRQIRAYSRRLATGNPEDIATAMQLVDELDAAVAEAVRAARETAGYSWAQLAEEAGMTRQGMAQRFGRRIRRAELVERATEDTTR